MYYEYSIEVIETNNNNLIYSKNEFSSWIKAKVKPKKDIHM